MIARLTVYTAYISCIYCLLGGYIIPPFTRPWIIHWFTVLLVSRCGILKTPNFRKQCCHCLPPLGEPIRRTSISRRVASALWSWSERGGWTELKSTWWCSKAKLARYSYYSWSDSRSCSELDDRLPTKNVVDIRYFGHCLSDPSRNKEKHRNFYQSVDTPFLAKVFPAWESDAPESLAPLAAHVPTYGACKLPQEIRAFPGIQIFCSEVGCWNLHKYIGQSVCWK